MKFRTHIHLKLVRKIYSFCFSLFSDFVTCSKRFNIQSEGSISQLWNTIGGENLVYMFIRHSYTQILNNVMVE